MKIPRLFSILAVTVFVIISAAPAFAQTRVQTIDKEGIQKLIADEKCRLFLVAIASWCGPCREELPILNKLYAKYKEKGMKLVAVSVDVNGPEAVQRVVDKLKLDFPVYWGGDKMAFDFNIFGVPTILVIREGKIQERIIGKRDDKYLEDKISSLMSKCEP